MSPNDPMQVTISLLPVQLALVHIPRSRLPAYSHPVLKQLLKPNPVFLNVTCNDIELSLFGDWDMGVEFSSVRRRSRKERTHEDIEVSKEPWSVLQIDSHSDSVDNSGARIHELSRPLANAGISILYQSSYTSDFLLVRSSRIKAVMHLLSGSGFDLYTEDSDKLISGMSPIVGPVNHHENAEDVDEYRPMGDLIRSGTGAVLTRTRSSTDSSLRSMASLIHDRHSSPSISPATSLSLLSPLSFQPAPLPSRPSLSSRTSSHSPSATDVRILEPDLTCVGLAEDAAETWTLKIVKLVAYPELIPGVRSKTLSAQVSEDARRALRLNGHLAQHESESPSPTSSPSDSSSSDEEEDDDSYFRTKNRNHSMSESSLSSSMSPCPEDDDEEVTSPVDMTDDEKLKAEVELEHLETADAVADPTSTPHVPVSHLPPTPPSRRNFAPDVASAITSSIPFFSFTRTQESSSLTTDVNILAKLFPAHERHMVICSGELDVVDQSTPSPAYEDEDEDAESEADPEDATSLMKCLQIDLRKYGLDKHGLVNRFSRVLEENGVNHMYSSTFMSANLLVDKGNAKRAQALLRTS